MATMYELTEAYQRLMEAAEDVDSDVFEDTMQSITDSIEDKAQGYAAVIAELQGEVDKRKKELDRIYSQKRTIENRIERMKQNLFSGMQIAGIQKLKGRYTVSIRNNAPHAVIKEENKVPAYLFRVERKPDRQAILKALKEGKEIPGASLLRGQSLQIR